MPLPTTQEVNLPACFPHCPFNAKRPLRREVVNINLKVIGLTRLGIKPESTASEADTLTTRPSELFVTHFQCFDGWDALNSKFRSVNKPLSVILQEIHYPITMVFRSVPRIEIMTVITESEAVQWMVTVPGGTTAVNIPT